MRCMWAATLKCLAGLRRKGCRGGGQLSDDMANSSLAPRRACHSGGENVTVVVCVQAGLGVTRLMVAAFVLAGDVAALGTCVWLLRWVW